MAKTRAGIFFIAVLPLCDGVLIPIGTHEAVNISFRVGSDGHVNMRVQHRSETFNCLHLYDDMNDVMEERAKNGSLILVRGSQGVLLQSSSDSIECRLRIRNQAGGAYTIHDVPSIPGVFSAYVAPSRWEPVEIEKHGDGSFIAYMVERHAVSNSREGYYEFSCKLPKMKYVKIGVIIDDEFINKSGSVEFAKEKARHLYKQASLPFEKQFNIKLVPFHILAPSDEDCTKCSFAPCGANFTDENIPIMAEFRTTAIGRRNAAWNLLSGCFGGSIAIGGYIGSNVVASISTASGHVVNIAHEIGHHFGMNHTFDHVGYTEEAGDGIMDVDYKWPMSGIWHSTPEGNNLFQFHKLHDEQACMMIRKLNDKEDMELVPWEERWAPMGENDSKGVLGIPTLTNSAIPTDHGVLGIPTLTNSAIPTDHGVLGIPTLTNSAIPTDQPSSSLPFWAIPLVCAIVIIIILCAFLLWCLFRSKPQEEKNTLTANVARPVHEPRSHNGSQPRTRKRKPPHQK